MNKQFLEHYRRLALSESCLSADPSTKVGAVVAFGLSHCWTGYNHLLPGTPKEYWYDREKKYKFVVHAEVAAIRSAGMGVHGGTLFCTAHPCKECAKLIVASGIRCVVCPGEPWRDDPAVIETVNDAKEIFVTCRVATLYHKD
ncbi:deoxycytidylate deaminase protein [Rhizobium phage RHph_I72]|nr:deoxycytidylate deaminase protein [Rhizobium phage RHph_I72]